MRSWTTIGEGRRGDDVGVADARCRGRVEVQRLVGEDGAGELAHLLAPDEVGRCRREDTPDELGVDWHPFILFSA